MKRFTEKAFTAILADVAKDTGLDEYSTSQLLKSVKMGGEAREHTGSKGVRGYFAIEGTTVTSWYYDWIPQFWKWQEAITAALAPFGLYLEAKNHVEYCVYPL